MPEGVVLKITAAIFLVSMWIVTKSNLPDQFLRLLSADPIEAATLSDALSLHVVA